MRLRLEKLLVWLALVAYGLTAGLPGGGLVLCLEADGHVTIEIANSGCAECCPADEAPADASLRVDSCPCVDVALVGVEAPLVKTKTSEASGHESALLAGDWVLPAPVLPAKMAALATRPDALRNSPIELLSCVVLRV